MDPSQPTTKPIRPRVLLVNDPTRGSAVSERLTLQGYDVYWARDTMEARWLWLPNFYDLVLIRLPRDAGAANGFVQRIKNEAPAQKIASWEEWEEAAQVYLIPKRPVSSVRPRGAASTPSSVESQRRILQMPKRPADQ